MTKLELLSSIQKLAALVHSEDLDKFNFTEDSIAEMRLALDKLSEEFVLQYC